MCLLFSLSAQGDSPLFQSELIFPVEAWHNHGSSLVECPDGSLLACWFHGSGERKADDVLILGARKKPGAAEWSQSFVMADTPDYPDCNPVLYVDPQGQLWFYWITVIANMWEFSLIKYRTSNDYMQAEGPPTWNWQDNIHITPRNFPDDMKVEWDRTIGELLNSIPDSERPLFDLPKDASNYNTRNVFNRVQQRLGWMTRIHPLWLPPGKLLLPLYTDAFSISIIAITEDGGKTWQTSQPLVGYGNIQPSLVRKNDGTIVAMMRENGPRQRIRIASSRDEGMTWSRVTEMDLPNPGSSVEVIRLANGHWLLIYNDTTDGRYSLNLSLSTDEGETWTWNRHLEKNKPEEGSFSYPSLLQSRDGMIHATYSCHLSGEKKTIKHVMMNEEWIQEGDPRPSNDR